MSLTLAEPQTLIAEIVQFLQQTYQEQGKKVGLVAVSGGIDSALSLTLLTKALGPSQVIAVLLPFADQNMDDARAMVKFNNLPAENVYELNIEPVVKAAATQGMDDAVRLGNLKARARMMILYDLAKKHDGLVCGTENKSEKHLGYFTRFGDEASDIEPLQHLYKTNVRQLARELNVPESVVTKAPSAGLWSGQTDEEELGFTYADADAVLAQVFDHGLPTTDTAAIAGAAAVSESVVERVLARVSSAAFKHQVPYTLQGV